MSTRIFLIFLISISANAAIRDPFSKIATLIYKEKCPNALIELYGLPDSSKKLYFEGICHNRLKNFPIAIEKYRKAKSLGAQFKDLDYEFGQALYANNDLIEARKHFLASAARDYKRASSYYYAGHISQLFEENSQARENYLKIVLDNKSEKSMTQVARFQLGEVFLTYAEKKYKGDNLKNVVDHYVLNQLQKAIEESPKTALVQNIQIRMKEIKRKYDLDPLLLKNGRLLPDKKYRFDISQDVRYDTNVTLTSDLPTTEVVDKESLIYETDIYGQYRFVFQKQILVHPFFGFNFLKHANSSNPDVYSNDAMYFLGGVKTIFEHIMGNKQAQLLFDYEYKYLKSDRDSEKKLLFQSKQHTYSFGEKFYLLRGPTTLKVKYKTLSSYEPSYDSTTLSFFMNQVFLQDQGQLMLFTGSIDLTEVEEKTNSTNSYMLRLDYVDPQFREDYILNPNFSVTFLDTKLQKSTRGMEITYKPGIKISRRFLKDNSLDASLSYDYSKKTSKDTTNFAYQKHEFNLNLTYSF